MKSGFRQSMAWLHTWSGLVVGWFLFLIFLAGTASYFRQEVSQYMRPEMPPAAFDAAQAADAAQRYLTRHAGRVERWFITPPTERNPGELSVFWRDEDGAHTHLLDPRSGERLEVRDTRGGDFFYRLHFDLHYMPARWARWIVGFCAMMMFVAIITGVITHKKIFKDFFTFRPGKRQRSWLDAHNVLAVLSLPYHALITYTGLITLMFMYMPWGVAEQFGEHTDDFYDHVLPSSSVSEASDTRQPLASLGNSVAKAQSHWGKEEVGFITVLHPGDANARINIRAGANRRVAYNTRSLEFDASGQQRRELGVDSGPVYTRDLLYGLHLGRFADTGLRILLFLSGLAGTAMVGTGLLLWSLKRAGKRPAMAGERLVAGLNLAVVCGLPVAMAAFFWANRLLPLGLAGRAQWEIHIFFLVWLGAAAHACFTARHRRAWCRQLWACAFAFGLLPLVNSLTTTRGLPGSLLAGGDTLFAGFDLAWLTIAALFALAARKLAAGAEPRVAAGSSNNLKLNEA